MYRISNSTAPKAQTFFSLQVMKAMKAELENSGLSEEEIFHKTQVLMKAFGKEGESDLAEYSLAGKQKNSALRKIDLSPKDFAQVWCEKESQY